MLKLFGYGDELRENFLNKPTDIELLTKNDYRTQYDINRPLKNIYEGVEQLNDFLDVFSDWQLTDDGVFENSLQHEFSINADDIIKVTLWNKTLSTPTSVDKVYAKLAPGIAGISHPAERQDSMIIVHRPNLNILERQLDYILHLFYYNESESVKLKWNQENNTIKAKVLVREHPEDPIQELHFGGDWYNDSVVGYESIQILADMYNHDILNPHFVNAIGNDLTQLLIEPIFEITATDIYYWEIVNGQVELNTTGDQGFRIGQFEVTNLATPTVVGIVQEHRRYGQDVRLEIFGTADDSYKIITAGGIEYDIAKGLNIHSDTGALIEINQLGDITINTAPGRNMDFGGVNILGITANIINTTAVFNQDGSMDIDASGAGEVFGTNAETHNETAVTKTDNITTLNETITTLNETIGTETKSVGTSTETITGKKTVNADEFEVNAESIDENVNVSKTVNAPQIVETTTAKHTISSDGEFEVNAESIDENLTMQKITDVPNVIENITNKKTVNADVELELNTPLLDINSTNITKNAIQEDVVIGTQNNLSTVRTTTVNSTDTLNADDSIENITSKKTINADVELELNTPLLDENATTVYRNSTNVTEMVTNKKLVQAQAEAQIVTPLLNEDVGTKTVDATVEVQTTPLLDENATTVTRDSTTVTEHVTGKKTLDIDTELQIDTALLDEKAAATATRNGNVETNTFTNQNNNVSGTETNVIGTLDETITTETKDVGTSTETITGTKTSNANAQRINADVDVIIAAPSITLDAGATGIINLIGEQQTVEGTTVTLEDNVIELNKNQTGVPAAGLISGFEVNRGTSTNAQLLFRESDDTWVNGLIGNLKAIANRQDTPTANGVPTWDSVNKLFTTSSGLTFSGGSLGILVATGTAPLTIVSTTKVANLNVDKVDGIDIVNTGAANGEIALWTGTTTIGTANKTIQTSIANNNAHIPTSAAVYAYARANYVADNSITIASDGSKGVTVSWTDGAGNAGSNSAANLNVDKVDGVDIVNTGAAANEIAIWTGTTTIGTANRVVAGTVGANGNLPTGQAVVDYVGTQVGSYLPLAGGTITGNLTVDGTFGFNVGTTVDTIETAVTNDDNHIPTSGAVVDYVGTQITTAVGNYLPLAGGTITGNLQINGTFKFDAAGQAVSAIQTTMSDVDTAIPTSGAVYDYVKANYLADGQVSLSALTGGFRFTYEDGAGNSTNVDLTTIDAASVDGVSINNSGAANGEIALWTGTSSIGTSNKTIVITVNETTPSDNKLLTEKAVVDYIASKLGSLNAVYA